MAIALYPGTFDPLTLGHEDIVIRASQIFDQVIVAVAKAYHKTPVFTVDERVHLIERVFEECAPNVSVVSFEGLLVDCLRQHGAKVVVRGLRSMMDYDFEVTLAGSNHMLDPHIETLLMISNTSYQHISSSVVREVARLGGNISHFVSERVADALRQKILPTTTKT